MGAKRGMKKNGPPKKSCCVVVTFNFNVDFFWRGGQGADEFHSSWEAFLHLLVIFLRGGVVSTYFVRKQMN